MSEFQKYIKLIETHERMDESFKDAHAKFSQDEDEEVVDLYIKKFKTMSAKNIISGSDKDIGVWIRAGWKSFKNFIDKKHSVVSKRQQGKNEKEDSIIVYEDSFKFIIIPLTEKASQHYGSGTRWCTSSKKNNKFNEYMYRKGIVLFYVISKDGDKNAASYNTNTNQFEYFDSSDEPLEEEDFEDITEITSDMILGMYRDNKDKINSHINTLDLESQKEIIRANPEKIKYINNPSEELILFGLKQSAKIMDYIDHLSVNAQKIIVKRNGLLLGKIDNPSYEIQLIAIQDNGNAINYVDTPTDEMKVAAVKSTPSIIRSIKNAPEDAQKAAIEQSSYAIQWIEHPTDNALKLHKKLWE